MAEPSGKKRPRDEEETGPSEVDCDETHGLERSLIFNDTLIALRMMHAQFPKIEKVVQQPFILQSQLYSSIKDRTQVDRDLEAYQLLGCPYHDWEITNLNVETTCLLCGLWLHTSTLLFFVGSLKKEKILRLFKLNTGQDDHAIMFFEDYINQMDIAVKKLGARNQHELEVFEWFKIHVIEYKLDVSIDHQELFILLSAGGVVEDEDITLLINAGFLTRQMIDPNMYWFAIPYIGSVLKGLSQGRKELLSFLNRRKHKEMLLALLEKKCLRLSPLDMRFHIRDLIGSGHVKVLQTPSGMLVRVCKD